MKKILFGVLMAMAAAGCTEYESGEVEQMLKDGKIVFSVSQAPTASDTRTIGIASEALQLSGAPQEYWLLPEIEPMVTNMTTRGTQLTSADFMTSFGVSCYKTPNGMDDLGGRTPDYFYNLKASRVGETSNYTISQDYYWPSNDERLWFYAYYPYNSGTNKTTDNTNVVLSASNETGPQTIDYTVATAATDQVDLMTAKTGKTTDFLTEGSPSVELQFEHQLTGIRFKVGDQFPTKGYIQSIQLKNVYTHGIYTIGGTWSHESTDIGNFIVEYANDTKVTDTPGQMITDDNAVFLMIPATFTYEANTVEDNKAKIIVRFWDGDATQTVEASLEGTTWTAGQTVTYSLSSEKLTTLKIDHIDYATTVDGAPYTEWKNGDEVGLYVVANGKNGGTALRYTNVRCTYSKPNEQTAGSWVIDQVPVGEDWKPVIMYPGDNYYFYYPYKSAGPDGTPSAGNESDASADKFWSSVVTAHTVMANQSTPANFKNSDLQIAKAIVPSDVNTNDPTLDGSGLAASTIKATMARKVGLAVVSLGIDQANKTKVFTNGNAGTVTETGNVAAIDEFSGNIPKQNGSKYYFYTIAGEETSINSVSTHKDAWEASLTYTLAAGASQEKTAYSDRRNWEYVDAVWNYSYTTANYYSFTTPAAGNYTMECWGAQGSALSGDYHGWNQYATTYRGGKGGYTVGTISLSQGMAFYVYVGNNSLVGETSEGNINSAISGPHGYSFNGGRYGSCGYGTKCGGGATDIRVISGNWNDFTSLKSRIMVAGGGGSAGDRGDGYGGGNGGYGGGLTGQEGESNSLSHSSTNTNWYGYYGTPGNQIGAGSWYYTSSTVNHIQQDNPPVWVVELPGRFGVGGLGQDGEGGGGWYGGGGAEHASGAGGSSYISGHSGCRAIKQIATVDTGGESNHESGSVATINNISYTFTGTSTIDGGHSQPAPGGGTQTGNSGNGYARITLSRW